MDGPNTAVAMGNGIKNILSAELSISVNVICDARFGNKSKFKRFKSIKIKHHLLQVRI